MSTYYWLGSYSSDVGNASNWSLYPITGVTLPPPAATAPTGGDSIEFQWASANVPVYPPVGSLTGGFNLVVVRPDFELDIGSSSTPFGISADVVIISKHYQSTPAKGTDTPSVYFKSTGSSTYLQTDLWGAAPLWPSAFGGATAEPPHVFIDVQGDVRTVSCGNAIDANNPNLIRSETLRFGDTVETNIGGYDNQETLVMSPKARTTIIFGPETNLFTPDVLGATALPVPKELIELKGSGIRVKIGRGADFSSNCGGIAINSTSAANSYNEINSIEFERASYAGTTGFNQSTRTTVSNLQLINTNAAPGLEKYDPQVTINHGVDITGELLITSGKFVVTPCQEVTRTYGSASKVKYITNSDFSKNPRVELAPNCSIRSVEILGSGSVPDIIYDAKPLKTLFIGQKIVEGYTGL
jgi:hypothetical protein